MAAYEFVSKNDVLRGMTLSSWLSQWVQWVHGASVDYKGRFGEILFTRGGLSYGYESPGAPRKQITPEYEEEVYITPNVPIYINVRTAFYFVGEPHPFGRLDTLNEVIAACRDDHSRSKVTASEIIGPNEKATPLKYWYIEAFGINVKVHPNSLLADQFEFPVERGTDLVGCAVADICVIRSLKNGKYTIKTANKGARMYESSSAYTINVGNSPVLQDHFDF